MPILFLLLRASLSSTPLPLGHGGGRLTSRPASARLDRRNRGGPSAQPQRVNIGKPVFFVNAGTVANPVSRAGGGTALDNPSTIGYPVRGPSSAGAGELPGKVKGG